MGTLQGALTSTGLVTEKLSREAEAQQLLTAEIEEARRLKPALERAKRIENLKGLSNPDKFRREARRLLLLDPRALHEVIQIGHAHGFHGKKNGGTRVNAQLHALSGAIGKKPNMKDEERCALVKQMFPNK